LEVKVITGRERAHDIGNGTGRKAGHQAVTPARPGSAEDRDSSEALITADGVKLHCRYWSTDAARAVVVLAHGFTGSCDNIAVVRQAQALRAAGFDVVSYDSRGHGRSEGQCALGDLESYDIAAAVARAKRTGLDVVLVGASMGAVAALRYAASGDNELAGVVSISAPATWRTPRSAAGALVIALARTRLGRQIAKHHLHVRIAPTWNAPAFPAELVRCIAVPVAIVHGDQDRYIPITDAHAIYQACNSPYRRLELVPGMGHAFDRKALPAVNNALDWLLAEDPSDRPETTLTGRPGMDETDSFVDRAQNHSLLYANELPH
jgi:alpha-beta hydrolase superfamily lysophospholipase